MTNIVDKNTNIPDEQFNKLIHLAITGKLNDYFYLYKILFPQSSKIERWLSYSIIRKIK